MLKDIGDLPGWRPLAGTKGGRLDRNLPADRAGRNGGTAVIPKFMSAQAGTQIRAKTYADLVAATRDVHGVVGGGVYAVSYSTVAIDALARVRGANAAGVRPTSRTDRPAAAR
ncbi:hypothetical protein Xcel_2327 [Xylanimonas cellulosilytica DSM 15894]|uniref:Uncharacterized protein n=1 Tax=Xylanimonas cellulosilytica (strain DSM 15894 / JCM 12276 / CECT 5975 / KCTC 9989 / LMG 20990 / NBRC 107835 / XIL07) TaxID=446471 RepID=D1BVM5_XYLCX|nr:hypothetical protein [Xylanimonas cellulosilytica]ACZ31344.1 hypothetical protein Xcel_2327 [Xylanimonas cellulosilytica DSM 15894]